MANWFQWQQAFEKHNIILPKVKPRDTAQSYAEVKSLGLKTVEWKSFDTNKETLEAITEQVSLFIEDYKPCLFIWDPRSSGELKKGFYFNQTTPDKSILWLDVHKNEINQYLLLITSQISNPLDGFIGNVFSNGKGRMVFESKFRPGVCNQRYMTQTSENDPIFTTDGFGVDKFEVTQRWGIGAYLDMDRINLIIDTFAHKPGYYEVVYGEHLGKWGVYCVGHEPLPFQHDFIFDMNYLEQNQRNHLKGVLTRELNPQT